MKLSTRTRYGMRALIELASNIGNGPLQTRVIAERQEISAKYLEQLMAALKAAGLVKSVRGTKGGYILARPADKIRLTDIFDVFERGTAPVECVKDKDYCNRAKDCIARQIWMRVDEAIRGVLDGTTLQGALDDAKKGRPDYQI